VATWARVFTWTVREREGTSCNQEKGGNLDRGGKKDVERNVEREGAMGGARDLVDASATEKKKKGLAKTFL